MQKRKQCFWVLSILVGTIFVLGVRDAHAAGPTYINKSISVPTVWTEAGSPYIIESTIEVKADFTIEPGVVVKFKKGLKGLNLFKNFSIVGTEDKKIIFTSFEDDSFGGDTNKNGGVTMPQWGDWNMIHMVSGSKGIIENATILYGSRKFGTVGSVSISSSDVVIKNSEIRYGGSVGIFVNYVQPVIEGNIISENQMGISVSSNKDFKIENNAIFGNIYGVSLNTMFLSRLDARNNWWGDVSGPYFKHKYFGTDNLDGKGNPVSDGVLFDPWLKKDPTIQDEGCQENCFSNVMFLPGIKASNLYMKEEDGDEDQLWVPNYFGDDVEELFLDKDGKSINNVYTNEPIKELPNGNIYKTFLSEMEALKNAGAINNFQSFAYDWRQSVEDVAKNGTPYVGEITKLAIADLQALAESSKSKKVTLVAHSNGGLLAKAMMLEIERLGMVGLVDKIIFVGSPQMGTPLATLSLLYGYDEAILGGTLISREEARTLAENMPGAYGLLPSEGYFKRAEDPLIIFSSKNTRYNNFFTAYGENIDSYQEFKKFLLGTDDKRTKPEADEVELENVLNSGILEKASEMHARLDAWVPPVGVEVIQIAGWGLDTVSGVEYKEKERTICAIFSGKIIPSCIGNGKYEPIYDPKWTVDGDNVVVTPSALMLPEEENIKRYWVDLYGHNDINQNRRHKNLLEVDSILKFIANKIKNVENTSLPQYIQTSRPSDYENAKPRLRMSLYSPLDIHLYDEIGNHTGPKTIEIEGHEQVIFEENIPNSYYYQMGERKYVGFPADEKIMIEMDGYALGSYTLKLEEVKMTADGEEIVSNTTFSDLPTTQETSVKFNFNGNGLEGMSKIEADVDGDEEIDYAVEKNLNGIAELPLDASMISQKLDLYAQLDFMDEKTQEFLQVKLKELIGVEEMIVKMEDKDNGNPKSNQIKLFNKKIDDLTSFIEGKLQDSILPLAQETLIKNLESIRI